MRVDAEQEFSCVILIYAAGCFCHNGRSPIGFEAQPSDTSSVRRGVWHHIVTIESPTASLLEIWTTTTMASTIRPMLRQCCLSAPSRRVLSSKASTASLSAFKAPTAPSRIVYSRQTPVSTTIAKNAFQGHQRVAAFHGTAKKAILPAEARMRPLLRCHSQFNANNNLQRSSKEQVLDIDPSIRYI